MFTTCGFTTGARSPRKSTESRPMRISLTAAPARLASATAAYRLRMSAALTAWALPGYTTIVASSGTRTSARRSVRRAGSAAKLASFQPGQKT